MGPIYLLDTRGKCSACSDLVLSAFKIFRSKCSSSPDRSWAETPEGDTEVRLGASSATSPRSVGVCVSRNFSPITIGSPNRASRIPSPLPPLSRSEPSIPHHQPSHRIQAISSIIPADPFHPSRPSHQYIVHRDMYCQPPPPELAHCEPTTKAFTDFPRVEGRSEAHLI